MSVPSMEQWSERSSGVGGELELLRADGPARARWLRLLEQWPEREIFADPCYLELFCAEGDSAACIVFSSEHGVVLYPIVLRSVRATAFWADRELFDVGPPPFGYAGPFVVRAGSGVTREQLLLEFYERYRLWTRTAGVIAEYTLFSPFCRAPSAYPGESILRMPIVVRDLDLSEAEMWADYRKTIRRNIRSAANLGISASVDLDDRHADDFLDIHRQTMERRQGLQGHRLTASFLDRLHRTLDGRFAYAHAWQDGRIVSSELLFVSATSIFSFRAGTVADKLATGAAKLLQHEIFLWAMQDRKRAVIVGGGLSGRDTLFAYKESFAPGGVRELWAGRWCLDPPVYRDVVERRRQYEASRGRDWDSEQEFFPAYRAP